MSTTVGGDRLVLNKEYITAGANLADKTLVLVGGTVPSSGAALVFGVVEKDTASGDEATVKTLGILEVIALGTVTKGAHVEVVTGTVYGNINGTSTSIACAGVQDVGSGYIVGRALTAGSSGDTVLIEIMGVRSIKPV